MIRRLLPILGITFIDILGFSMLIPMLPYFVTHFGASPLVVGFIFSVFSFCQLIAGPIWGNVSDRIGRKGVLIVSQIGATVGWGMLAFAPNIAWVFVARIVEGVSGGNIGITQAYVADVVEPRERARAFGYIGATFGAGMVFGPVGAGILFSHYGFVAPFLAASALQFVTLLATLALLPETRGKRGEVGQSVGFGEIAKTFRDPNVSRFLWQKLALSLALYGWFGVIALYLKAQLHFTLVEADYYFSLFAISNVIINGVLVGRLSNRLGDRSMSSLGLGSLVFSFALVPFVHGVPALSGVLLLFSIGMALANTGITALISNAAANERQGTVLGVSSSLDSLSGMVSPPISTGLLGRLGAPFAGVTSLVFAAIALALGLAAARFEAARRPLSTTPEP